MSTSPVLQQIKSALSQAGEMSEKGEALEEKLTAAAENLTFAPLGADLAKTWVRQFGSRMRGVINQREGRFTEKTQPLVDAAQQMFASYQERVDAAGKITKLARQGSDAADVAVYSFGQIIEIEASLKSKKTSLDAPTAKQILKFAKTGRDALQTAEQALHEVEALQSSLEGSEGLLRAIKEERLDPDEVLRAIKSAVTPAPVSAPPPKPVTAQAPKPTPQAKVEPVKKAEPPAPKQEHKPPTPGAYRPPNHKVHGPPSSNDRIEQRSYEFFCEACRQGLPQDKVGEALFSKPIRLEGMTVHDALAYDGLTEKLYLSIEDLVVKLSAPSEAPTPTP